MTAYLAWKIFSPQPEKRDWKGVTFDAIRKQTNKQTRTQKLSIIPFPTKLQYLQSGVGSAMTILFFGHLALYFRSEKALRMKHLRGAKDKVQSYYSALKRASWWLSPDLITSFWRATFSKLCSKNSWLNRTSKTNLSLSASFPPFPTFSTLEHLTPLWSTSRSLLEPACRENGNKLSCRDASPTFKN